MTSKMSGITGKTQNNKKHPLLPQRVFSRIEKELHHRWQGWEFMYGRKRNDWRSFFQP